jgi:Pregnancy-associated plasma protein-A
VTTTRNSFAAGQVPSWGVQGEPQSNANWANYRHFVITHDALLYQPRELANVLAHELGHLLSLNHPFSQLTDRSCPAVDVDGIGDTRRYDVLTYTDLGSQVSNGVPVRLYRGCQGGEFVEANIMGYTTFHSSTFTHDQRRRMRYQLDWAYLYPTPINQTR